MSTADLLTKTVDAGILAEDGSEAIRLGDAFAAHLESVRAETAERSADDLLERLEPFAPADEREGFADVPREDAATYLALAEFADALTHEERLRLLTVIDQLRRGVPPDDGSPDAFVPVHGDRLTLLVRLHSPAIAYVWLDDCDPCDAMRAEFDELFPEPPDDLALFSVYGPDWAPQLQEEFDVTGGPTTLFVKNGSVDLRLYGAQYRDVLEREIERLRENE